MKLCIPVIEDQGIKSPVSAHFGSAPLFVIVDTDSGVCRSIPNGDLHHAHGMCQPLKSIAGEPLDGIAVGGIGMGALGKIMAAGIRVFITREQTVEEVVSSVKAGTLQEATPAMACGHHGNGGGCH